MPLASRTVFILAGEASGDRYGAALAETLRALSPGLAFRGIGGPRMRAAGADLLFDSSDWGTVGIADALRSLPRLSRRLRGTVAHLRADPPSLLVLVDFGAFNVRVARALSGAMPTLYFIPPGSWSRTGRRGDLPDLVDAIATPFPWSAERLQDGRARVEWVGHPLLDLVRPTLPRREACAAYDLDPGRSVVLFVPGSRRGELRHVLPVMAEAARLVAARTPEVQIIAAVAPTASRDTVAAAFPGARLLDGLDYDAAQLADAASVASGTATLELALLGVPMVVAYRGPLLTELQYLLLSRVLRRVGPVALPNLVAGRPVVPELLQRRASPAAVADHLAALLADADRSAAMRRDLAHVAHTLGSPGALERTARLALALIAP